MELHYSLCKEGFLYFLNFYTAEFRVVSWVFSFFFLERTLVIAVCAARMLSVSMYFFTQKMLALVLLLSVVRL